MTPMQPPKQTSKPVGPKQTSYPAGGKLPWGGTKPGGGEARPIQPIREGNK